MNLRSANGDEMKNFVSIPAAKWLITRRFMRLITFIRKNVILVNRSTVDLRSINFSWLDAGKLFLYMDKSILSELCS